MTDNTNKDVPKKPEKLGCYYCGRQHSYRDVCRTQAEGESSYLILEFNERLNQYEAYHNYVLAKIKERMPSTW